MSLKFLSKKSWHTTNLDNVEKVWIQEQKAAEESKKQGELQKQILEERQIQELRQLQVASGQQVKTVDTTLDWMYEGPSAQQDQSTEEYLLGKIYKPQENISNDVKKVAREPGSLWLNKISTNNDIFTRTHEDPLLVMKKNEKISRENVLNNPVKMARIRHKIATELEQKEAEKREKKAAKKERKKEHKHRDRSHSRSRSPVRNLRSLSRDKQTSHRSRSRDRVVNIQETDLHHHRLNDWRGGDTQHSDSNRRYGLIGRSNDTAVPVNRDYLGPRPDLISMKVERDAIDAAAAKRPRESAQSLTQEEKALRLAQMQKDAEVNDAMRYSRIKNIASTKGISTNESSRVDPSFLQSMRSEVYASNEGATMQERLQQNRYYMQKSSDMESHGFTKR